MSETMDQAAASENPVKSDMNGDADENGNLQMDSTRQENQSLSKNENSAEIITMPLDPMLEFAQNEMKTMENNENNSSNQVESMFLRENSNPNAENSIPNAENSNPNAENSILPAKIEKAIYSVDIKNEDEKQEISEAASGMNEQDSSSEASSLDSSDYGNQLALIESFYDEEDDYDPLVHALKVG